MDKQHQYYIVIEGTSCCAFDGIGDRIIFKPVVVDDFLLKFNGPFAKNNYEKITVEEYERTFTEMIEY